MSSSTLFHALKAYSKYMRNELSEAELERLAILAEECGEVVQIVNKIIRHGYGNFHPETMIENKQALERELGDLAAIIRLMGKKGDVRPSRVDAAAEAKGQKLLSSKYVYHQGK